MASLDWSDPSKLQRRDGGEVLACGVNEGMSRDQAFWALTRSSSGEPPTLSFCYATGHCTVCKQDCPGDIIPRPREPRTMEAWIDSRALDESRPTTRTLYTYPQPNCVRVRITEVVDE